MLVFEMVEQVLSYYYGICSLRLEFQLHHFSSLKIFIMWVWHRFTFMEQLYPKIYINLNNFNVFYCKYIFFDDVKMSLILTYNIKMMNSKIFAANYALSFMKSNPIRFIIYKIITKDNKTAYFLFICRFKMNQFWMKKKAKWTF